MQDKGLLTMAVYDLSIGAILNDLTQVSRSRQSSIDASASVSNGTSLMHISAYNG